MNFLIHLQFKRMKEKLTVKEIELDCYALIIIRNLYVYYRHISKHKTIKLLAFATQ